MMLLLLAGGFLSLFNETILNVALPRIMSAFHVAATTVQWLSTGYVLVVAVMVPTVAFLMQSFDTKKIYIGAMTVFLAGTLLACAAPNFPILLAARLLQAGGTGLLAPVMITACLAISPQARFGFVMGLCTCVILVGPALGPIVSGVVLQVFDWPALFGLLVPLVILCIVGAFFFVEKTTELTHPTMDRRSILLSSLGFAALVYGMSILGSESGARTAAAFGIGAAALVLFCRRQLALEQPMLDVRIFRKPTFALGALLVIIIQMVQFSMNIVLPMLFENCLHLSSMASALYLFPAVFLCSVMTLVAGRIYDRKGGNLLIAPGVFLMAAALLLLSTVTAATGILAIAAMNVGIFLGISLAWSPVQSTALSELAPQEQAHGITITNTFIQLGAALGTPLFVGLMSAGQNAFLRSAAAAAGENPEAAAMYSGFGFSMRTAALIMLAAVALALALGRAQRKRAAARG